MHGLIIAGRANSLRYNNARICGRSLSTLLGFAIAAALISSICEAASANASYSWVYANPRFVKLTEANSNQIHGTAGPVPLDYTHMGMIERLPNGSILAAWQGSDNFWEGSATQGIYTATSEDDGLHWTAPHLAIPPEVGAVWAPVLHVEGDRVWMLYTESRPPCTWWGEGGLHWDFGGDIKMTWSDDNGRTWTMPKLVYAFEADGGIGKMVANKIAINAKGEWLLPFWRELGNQQCKQSPNEHGRPGVLISPDKGASWQKVEVSLEKHSKPTWLIEAAIAGYRNRETNETGYLQVFRTQIGFIYFSTSSDGHDWTPARATALPNPNSKVDLVSLPDGSVLLAYNNNATARTALTLAQSLDGGLSWQDRAVLEKDPKGMFSYPTILYNSTQESVKVIYSVVYPPKNGSQPLSPRRFNRVDAMILAEEAVSEGRGQAPIQAVNAWGADAYGLRIAALSL